MPYPSDAECRTIITAPEGYNVLLHFTEFQLESDTSVTCDNDYDSLTLYDGLDTHLIGRYCGTTIAESFQSGGQTMTVVFKSNAYLNYKGFEIEYEFVPGK